MIKYEAQIWTNLQTNSKAENKEGERRKEGRKKGSSALQESKDEKINNVVMQAADNPREKSTTAILLH